MFVLTILSTPTRVYYISAIAGYWAGGGKLENLTYPNRSVFDVQLLKCREAVGYDGLKKLHVGLFLALIFFLMKLKWHILFSSATPGLLCARHCVGFVVHVLSRHVLHVCVYTRSGV